ncbi:MAG: SRPBCC domain-containing protein [Thermoplasmata archaeon]|nr:SRPBCC domain-containing protein [Thermoplasmata archaeon]
MGTLRKRTIRQTILVPADPDAVYQALMTTRGHEAFTGAKARISPKVGGTFMAWGGYIHGRNLELVPGRKIVQSWTPSDETWPAEYASKVTYRLAKVRGGTRISFTHSGVPVEHAGHLSKGWHESYWEPLRRHFRRHG